jgi:hypothetical protein
MLTTYVNLPTDDKARWALVTFPSVLIVLVLIVLEPFSISNPDNNLLFNLLTTGYGFATFAALVVCEWLIRRNVRALSRNTVRVRDFAAYCAVALFILSAAVFSYYQLLRSSFEGTFRFPEKSFWEFFTYCAALTFFVLPVLFLFFRNRSVGTEGTAREKMFVVKNGKEHFTVAVDDLLYIESHKNYSELNFMVNGHVEKKMIRSSLKSIMEHHPTNTLVRCHQGFIVNTTHILSFRDVSDGAYVTVRGIVATIPVSRAALPLLREKVLNVATS